MYYEEKVINGILMCRTQPDGEWRQVSVGRLNDLCVELMNENKRLANQSVKWTSIEDETPPDSVPVITYPGWATFGEGFAMDEWIDSHKCFLLEIEEGRRVTHWALPEVPK